MRALSGIKVALTLGCLLVTAITFQNCSPFDVVRTLPTTQQTSAESGGVKLIREGAEFVPRGANYARIDLVQNEPHTTFNIGVFDQTRATQALADLKAGGYNTVRVFVSRAGFNGAGGATGMKPEYAGNLRTFLQLAKAYGLVVTLTTQWLPDSYLPLISQYEALNGGAPAVDLGTNAVIMRTGYVKAFATFWKDIVKEVASQSGTLFSIDVLNEGAFDVSYAPFSWTSGTFVGGDGASYDMAIPSQRQKLADVSTILWANELTAAIKSSLSDTLVTASVYSPVAVGRTAHDGLMGGVSGDNRRPLRLDALAQSKIDYLDLHAYAEWGKGQFLAAETSVSVTYGKPLILGEVGVSRQAVPSIQDAANAIRDLLNASCQANVTGWVYWTWDSDEAPQHWNLKEQNGLLNGVFAPAAAPTLCGVTPAPMPTPAVYPPSLPGAPPAGPFKTLYRLYKSTNGDRTTLETPSLAGYIWDQTTFQISRESQSPFTKSFYRCQQKSNLLYFNSTDSNCEGQTVISHHGYVAPSSSAQAPYALYRCYKPAVAHLTTKSTAECTGNGFAVEGVLGYIP